MKKIVLAISLVFSLFSLNLLSQENDDLLVAIELDKKLELRKIELLNLPVYFQFEKVLITSLNQKKLKYLKDHGINSKIIDINPENNKYYIACYQRGEEVDYSKISGQILYKNGQSVFLKNLTSDIEELQANGVACTEVKKKAFLFKSKSIKISKTTNVNTDSLIAEVLSEINVDSVRHFIQKLQDFGTRFLLATTKDTVSSWVSNQFIRMGFTDVQYDSFLCHTRWNGIDTTTWQRNVVVTIPGANNPEHVYIIGGHYDSFSSGDPFSVAPGATDDASGTAAVLETARVFKTMNFQPECTIKLIGFAAEELLFFGDGGSRYYAQTARQNNMDIKLMINHDMISFTHNPVPNSLVSVNFYTGYEHWRELAKYLTNNYTSITAVDGFPNIMADAGQFWANGYAPVYFEENDFSPFYHTPQDLLVNNNMEFCTEIIKGSSALLIYSSETPTHVEDFRIFDRGDGNSLLASWLPGPEPDLAGYRIYVGTNSGNYDSVYTITDTSFIVSNLIEGTQYFIGVGAHDFDGNESFINVNSGIPYTIPLVPENFIDDPAPGIVNLFWSANSEYDLLGYNIYRSQSSGGTSIKLNGTVISDTFFTDNTAPNGLYYYYTVRAVDSLFNESTSSEEIRSRVVSLDQGILIVDETFDGNGSLLSPTDAEVDSFYSELLDGFDSQSFDVNTEAGIKLADLGAFSTVIWHGDDYINQDIPFQSKEDIREYLQYGGNFLYSGYKPVQAFHESVIYPQNFSSGDFIYDMLKIQNVELKFGSRFIGAIPFTSGYMPVYVDTNKTQSNTNFHLRNIEGIAENNEGTAIYLYDTNFDTTTAFGSMKDQTVGVEYIGNDYKIVVFSFPLYYMNLDQAKNMIQHILIDKFVEPITIENINENLPSEFFLYQNYPNPFNPVTKIEYSIPRTAKVEIIVFDILGREVAKLVNETKNAGTHQVVFDGSDFSSGLYFIKMKSGSPSSSSGQGFIQTRKMLLMK